MSITEAKRNLGRLIRSLDNGVPVVIVRRGVPVARLAGLSAERDARAARLVRAGAMTPAKGRLARCLYKTAPPRPKENWSAVQALIEERHTGR